MSSIRKRLYDVIDLYPGNLTLTDIFMEKWGSILHVSVTYRHPPQEKRIRLSFFDVRGIEWHVQKSAFEIEDGAEAQLMTHDLGESHYLRTARFASTIVELIFSYRIFKIEVEEDDS